MMNRSDIYCYIIRQTHSRTCSPDSSFTTNNFVFCSSRKKLLRAWATLSKAKAKATTTTKARVIETKAKERRARSKERRARSRRAKEKGKGATKRLKVAKAVARIAVSHATSPRTSATSATRRATGQMNALSNSREILQLPLREPLLRRMRFRTYLPIRT